jgi:L-lactate dehydrogenase (cytochrome)/(S)-mandelate dehydrogenase
MNPFKDLRFRAVADRTPITIEDYRLRARRRLPDMIWPFLDGGAEDEVTLQDNRAAFSRWALRTRVLTGHADADMRTTIAGVELDFPVFLSPTGSTGLLHSAGERAAAVAAERVGTRAVISTAASYTPEEIAAATRESHFFQLYPWANPAVGGRELTAAFIRRAKNAGYGALFVTVDAPAVGFRNREKRKGMGNPPVLSPGRLLSGALHPRWALGYLRDNRTTPKMLAEESRAASAVGALAVQGSLMRPDLDWDDFAWMREHWDRPLVIKGILHPDDAERAVELGADGVMVSNHGGRQLDAAVSSLDALADIVDRVGARVPVYLDGGIRRGTDVVTALALGASAVGIGRPWIYGLVVEGQPGVERVLTILRDEIRQTLLLMGVGSVRDLDRSVLVRRGEWPTTFAS